MSPIEHEWDIVGRRIARDLRPVASTDELWLRIQTIWNTLPQTDIKNLFNSIPRRVAALIAARGGSGTSESEGCPLHKDLAQDALDRPVVKKTTIVRNARVQPIASSAAIQAWVTPSLGPPVSSRTIRRRLAEGHLGSRRALRVLLLTPTHQRLLSEWFHARGNWTGAEWNQVVFSDARANPDSISAVMTIVFVCGDPVVNASILPLLYSNTPLPQLTCCRHRFGRKRKNIVPLSLLTFGLAWEKKGKETGYITAARVSQDCLRTVTTLPWPPDPQIFLQSSISGIISNDELASHEFERTRGKVTANMERNVLWFHTELVCLNARSYRVVQSR
ncbi:transposable element Tcb1 transposase [Trichonephila clavipes]|nr:transposable element Tcb1 transposase [Trichonephila clavipes]